VAMGERIAHRGPDGSGYHCARGVGLGHRRLSIIDVSGGAQPLSNEDGTVWVTFNGEIYNFPELTARLARRGHRFRTHSDTEVIVHAYEEYGDDFVTHLNGMFAFAIHDMARDRVVLGRDHLGIKPLFYSRSDGMLVFASEIKALLVGTGNPPRVSRAALQEYLIFRYITGTGSFFEDVHRLPGGCLGIWERGCWTLRPFWHPPIREHLSPGSLEEAADHVEHLLTRSVEAQMMSEVPLGAFCSGGVDSGLVTAYAAAASPHRLQTFSVGFRDAAWDESGLAARSASRFATAHNTLLAEPDDFMNLLPHLVWFQDEPLSHPNSIPIYQLSRFARQCVTVILTGEGADELFCGYPRYHIARVVRAMDAFPAGVHRVITNGVTRLPGHRAAKLAGLLDHTIEDSLVLNSAYATPGLVAELTNGPVDEALRERRRLLDLVRSSDNDVETLSRYELLTYLGSCLDRMDRMSMACGLEGRVPFLDLSVVDFALRLPTSFKLRRRETKRVLKILARRRLDAEVSSRSKSGFGVPLADWFRSPILAAAIDRLRDPEHPAAMYFQRSVIERLIADHTSGRADHGEILWMLTNVYIWFEVAGSPAPSPTL